MIMSNRFQLVSLCVFLAVLAVEIASLSAAGEFLREKHWAYLNITSKSGAVNAKKNIILADAALYGIQSSKRVVSGQLVQVKSRTLANNLKSDVSIVSNAYGRLSSGGSSSETGRDVFVSGRGVEQLKKSSFAVDNKGCTDYLNRNLPDQYIALVSRGDCTFDHKLMIAMRNNASAIIIYNTEQDLFTMYTRNSSIVNVLVPSYIGSLLGSWIEQVETYVTISPGPVNYMPTEYFGRPPLLLTLFDFVLNNSLLFFSFNSSPTRSNIVFVFGTFAVVIVIGFLWLIIYFIQKYRLANAKKNLNKKLRNAMMTALQKMKIRQLKPGDVELNEVCAICLENFQANDFLRTLPCNHYFHQKDIDLWLIENRSCPMCKLDVLKAYGIELSRNQNMFTRVVRQLCERPAQMHIRHQQQQQLRLRAQHRVLQQRIVVGEAARQDALVVENTQPSSLSSPSQASAHPPPPPSLSQHQHLETSTVILIPPLNVQTTGVNNDAMSVTSLETMRIDSDSNVRRMKLGESSNNVHEGGRHQQHGEVESQPAAGQPSTTPDEPREGDEIHEAAGEAAGTRSTVTIDESTNEIVLHSFNKRQNVDRKLRNSSFVDIQL